MLKSPQELALHDKSDDAWCAINGRVYDVTPYLGYHPGGEKQLMRGAGATRRGGGRVVGCVTDSQAALAGKDATELFRSIHSWVNVEVILAPCWLGMLAYGGGAAPSAAVAAAGAATPVRGIAAK